MAMGTQQSFFLSSQPFVFVWEKISGGEYDFGKDFGSDENNKNSNNDKNNKYSKNI